MIITKRGCIIRCNCGVLFRNHSTYFKQSCKFSSKPPTNKDEIVNEEKPAKSVSGPFSPEQLKVVSDTSSKLAEALKLKYQETLKQGTLWYQDKLITLSQRTNGGEW
jgi:hypothetical protein